MENRNYKIKRENVYVGRVVKIVSGIYRYAHVENGIRENTLDATNWVSYRTMLFVPDEKNLANDLLYRSPHYPVFNITDDERCLNLGTNATAVKDIYNLGALLDYAGFEWELEHEDILRIRSTFFSKGLKNGNFFYSDYLSIDAEKELERLLEEYSPILKDFGDSNIIELFVKRLNGKETHRDAFKPHPDEGAIKKLSFLPTKSNNRYHF